jgi:YkoY family integral membrane protein
VGAFIFRITCLMFASALIKNAWVALLGGSYLLYLPIKHFLHKSDGHTAPPAVRTFFGLSLFWSTVVTIELTDIVFAIDSILVAVGMSNKLYVVITGALLGLVAMRFVAGGFLKVIERYPTIVDGAYVIVAWVGVKLLIEYAHKVHWISWEVPRSVSVVLIFVIFGVSLLLGRNANKQYIAEEDVQAVGALLEDDEESEQEVSTRAQET